MRPTPDDKARREADAKIAAARYPKQAAYLRARKDVDMRAAIMRADEKAAQVRNAARHLPRDGASGGPTIETRGKAAEKAAPVVAGDWRGVKF